jgi:hypothetical protein
MTLLAVAATGIYFSSCDDDDDNGPSLTGDEEVYTLNSVSNPGISGTVTFAKQTDNAVLITIELSGTQSGNSHPAHIHFDNAATTGGIALDFTPVDGGTGRSETVVTQLNDGTAITYEQLIDFDGYVNVHLSATELSTLIAQGDIGQNALTGESKEYPLGSVSDPAISGTVTFEERLNGEALATIELVGTQDGDSHPSHIHNNAAAQGGGIAIDFNNIDGATGISKTNVAELNDGTPIDYAGLLEFNGYVNVHLSSSNLGTLIAQGDIGVNELTGDSEVYDLNPVSDPEISGTVTFAKRVSGLTLITIQLTGTEADGDHPSHIHNNSAQQTGGIAIDLKNVNGATGRSATHVTQLNNGTAITYDELVNFNGYVNVHLSSTSLSTLIAQGNIGSNAE